MSARAAALLLLASVLAGCAAPAPPAPAPGAGPACPAGPSTHPFALRSIDEASGLARSGRQSCLVWVHEDSGAEPLLHATDALGAHRGTLRLDAPAIDWEDIAPFTFEGRPYLLVADVGNNGLTRAAAAFVLLPEPDVAALPMPFDLAAEGVRVVNVRYPSGPFNAESVAVDAAADEILVVSKGGVQALYAAPLSAAMRDAEVSLAFRAAIPALNPAVSGTPFDLVRPGPGELAATAMDLDAAATRVAVLTYREALVWERAPGQPWAEALQGAPGAVRVPPEGARQMEAIAFSADGAWLLVGAEQGSPNSMLSVLPLPR